MFCGWKVWVVWVVYEDDGGCVMVLYFSEVAF